MPFSDLEFFSFFFSARDSTNSYFQFVLLLSLNFWAGLFFFCSLTPVTLWHSSALRCFPLSSASICRRFHYACPLGSIFGHNFSILINFTSDSFIGGITIVIRLYDHLNPHNILIVRFGSLTLLYVLGTDWSIEFVLLDHTIYDVDFVSLYTINLRIHVMI